MLDDLGGFLQAAVTADRQDRDTSAGEVRHQANVPVRSRVTWQGSVPWVATLLMNPNSPFCGSTVKALSVPVAFPAKFLSSFTA
jgi:hypothetical protein